jgi:hypothetical protein
MWSDLTVRFFIGGAAVSLFAILGDLFKPKSFGGLFSAAPSIALASLALALSKHGGSYASVEGKSMMAGALAFYVYSQVVSWCLLRYEFNASRVGSIAISLWFVFAFGMWLVVLE